MINGTIMTTSIFTYLNVFFTLFLGLIALIISESKMKLWLKIVLIVLLDERSCSPVFLWHYFCLMYGDLRFGYDDFGIKLL